VRFLADECCPAPIVAALRTAGHDVLHALESHAGASDRNLAELARREDRIVITEDYDFGELAVRGQLSLPGLIILFLNEATSEIRAARVLEIVEAVDEGLRGQLTIIDVRRTRRRALRQM
jgi:predicted nuclease of predicted toxin-antitoxin system